jgi:hypothetical protein
MKVLAGLALAALAFVGSASANTYTVVVPCGSFTNNNPPGFVTSGSTLSGTLSPNPCGGINVSGVAGISSISGFLLLDNDMSSVQTNNDSTQTVYTITGSTVAISPVTLNTSTPDGITTTYTCGGAGVYAGPYLLNGALIPAGCNTNGDALTGLSISAANPGLTIAYANSVISGTMVAATGYADIVYTYTTVSGTPEPVSMLLFGSGLLAVSLIGRKKLSRK